MHASLFLALVEPPRTLRRAAAAVERGVRVGRCAQLPAGAANRGRIVVRAGQEDERALAEALQEEVEDNLRRSEYGGAKARLAASSSRAHAQAAPHGGVTGLVEGHWQGADGEAAREYPQAC